MNNDLERIKQDLAHNLFLKKCDETFLSTLAQDAQYQRFSKGKVLFLHEDEAERFYVVKKGWVKLFRETLDGHQAVIDILKAPHMIGETALFDDHEYSYSAEAIDDIELISLPLSALEKEIQSNGSVALAMLNSVARYKSLQEKEIEHRSLQNAAQRIGCFLLKLGHEHEGPKLKIQLPYDKTLIASRLGMQPETFSRALGKLKKAIPLDVHGSTIELESLDALIAYTCSACSSEYPCKTTKGCLTL